jgi:carboxypeptidase PM20D1
VISILEAIERLLAQGYRPDRTVYLAFGGDEERGGYHGAALLAQTLKRRGVSAAFVLDEGLFIVDGIVPGVSGPVALVGIAEKGAANLELVVETEGGHASMPHGETAFGILSRAIGRLEANPFRAELTGVPEAMFTHLAPEMGFMERAVFANLWLFSPLVRRQLVASPSSNALLRTTAAPTIVEGGTKVNVLPSRARAVFNVRLRPGDTLDDVMDHVQRVIDDERITARVLDGASEASPVSPTERTPFKTVQRVARETFPGVVVAPALMIARTDSRHYMEITSSVFRFTPVQLTADDLGRIHGVDERLSLDGLANNIRFYYGLIRAATSGDAAQLED